MHTLLTRRWWASAVLLLGASGFAALSLLSITRAEPATRAVLEIAFKPVSTDAVALPLRVAGLRPETSYPLHLHAGTCESPSASTGHLGAFETDQNGRGELRAVSARFGAAGQQTELTEVLLLDGDHVIEVHDPVGTTVACSVLPEQEADPSGGGQPPAESPSSMFGPQTDIAEVDPVLAALEAGTMDAVSAVIRMTDVPCSDAQGSGGPPQCGAYGSTNDPSRPTPPPQGSIVPAFPVSSCDAGWLSDPATVAESLVPRVDRLVAVVETTAPIAVDPERLRPTHGLMVGTSRPDVPALLMLDAGYVVGIKWTCGEGAGSLLEGPTSDFYGAPRVLVEGPGFLSN